MTPTRKSIPLSVKVQAALIALGIDPSAVDWHHEPPLAMRPVNPKTGDTEPPANDPRHIVPLARADHKARTFGTHVPLSGDVQKIKKLRRVEKKAEAFRARLLAKRVIQKHRAKRQGGSIPSRPFPKAIKRTKP